jgi:hypothetical protein
MVEAKYAENAISPNLRYFRERYPIEALQLAADLRQERDEGGVELRRASDWLVRLEI